MRKIQDFKTLGSKNATLVKRKFEATFKAGKAPELVGKFARVISKRVGGGQGFASSIGIPYSNEYGKFMGFFGSVAKKFVRFNFLLGGNDTLYSIDLYASDGYTIENTIDLMGYNVPQVVGMIADVITGAFGRYQEGALPKDDKIKEAGTRTRTRTLPYYCFSWLIANPTYLQDIKSGRFQYDRYVDEFLQYIQKEFNSKKSQLKASALQFNIRLALEQNNMGVPAAVVPSVAVKEAPSGKEIHFDDPIMSAIFEKAYAVSPKEKIDEMRGKIRQLADSTSSIYAMIIYGKAGVGKDHHVEEVLREEGVQARYITAPIPGYTGLLHLLYTNQSDMILVFSDNDSTFKDPSMVNLWKNVLDTKPVRMVNLAVAPLKIRGTNLVIEDDFAFSSKVIFISNQTEFDSAILSRLKGNNFFLNFTDAEVLELIREALADIYIENPDITDTHREVVFEFIEKALPGLTDLDFRAFRLVLSIYQLAEKEGRSDQEWKVQAIRHLEGLF